jgi:hypothetical protein
VHTRSAEGIGQKEHLQIQVIMSNLKMDNGDRETYYYSWIITMLLKKPEDIQRIIAAKLWYVMVISDHCGQLHW